MKTTFHFFGIISRPRFCSFRSFFETRPAASQIFCKGCQLQRLLAEKYFLIRHPQLRKRLQSLFHCNGCWPFTISLPFILILGSKEVLSSAKNLNVYLFLSITKVMIGLNDKQMSSNHSSNERKNSFIFLS